MTIPKFDPKELNQVGQAQLPFLDASIAIYDYPISGRDALKRAYAGEPAWQTGTLCPEALMFMPSIFPDNIARGMAMDASVFSGKQYEWGGKDMFGIEWVYVPSAMGSMVKPGAPTVLDANEIADKIQFPDVDSWDWAGSAKENEALINSGKAVWITILNGWYERLISFMDFEGAAMALIDEDQQDAVKAFFDKLSDLYINILAHVFEYYPTIDIVSIHDDWGSQMNSFFSPAVAEEMIVPYMKKVTDFIHANGRYADLHSCGHNVIQVPNYIKAGFDAWSPQTMNDIKKIYDQYGDQILIGTLPRTADPNDEADQRAAAKEYVEYFCRRDKPSLLSMYYAMSFTDRPPHTPVIWEEIYKLSRIAYSD